MRPFLTTPTQSFEGTARAHHRRTLPGLHGSIGPVSAFATVSTGPRSTLVVVAADCLSAEPRRPARASRLPVRIARLSKADPYGALRWVHDAASTLRRQGRVTGNHRYSRNQQGRPSVSQRIAARNARNQLGQAGDTYPRGGASPLAARSCHSRSIEPSSALWKYCEQTSQPFSGRSSKTQAPSVSGKVVSTCTQSGGS